MTHGYDLEPAARPELPSRLAQISKIRGECSKSSARTRNGAAQRLRPLPRARIAGAASTALDLKSVSRARGNRVATDWWHRRSIMVWEGLGRLSRWRARSCFRVRSPDSSRRLTPPGARAVPRAPAGSGAVDSARGSITLRRVVQARGLRPRAHPSLAPRTAGRLEPYGPAAMRNWRRPHGGTAVTGTLRAPTPYSPDVGGSADRPRRSADEQRGALRPGRTAVTVAVARSDLPKRSPPSTRSTSPGAGDCA